MKEKQMEEDVLVKVEGLSKKFCKSLKKSLKYGMYDLVANLRGKPTSDDLRPDEFWALKDINFELRRGECLGLIGHNGAGKSTLLKILNGLINPDHGKVTMRGRVGALIELGAGFNQVMTGRENIYNNGAILGFTREEIDTKVEEIIDFAEIREFIDAPVRNYSSGMKVRLGFAVAAQMEPDVLIIDEVLAVGDVGFRIKCLNRIGELLNNCAIIFVSHSMPQVSRICTSGILMQNGTVKSFDLDISDTISKYYKLFEVESARVLGGSKVVIQEVTATVNNRVILKGNQILQGEKLKLSFVCKWNVPVSAILCKIFFINNDSRNVLDVASSLNYDELITNGMNNKITVETDQLYLNGGNYSITLVIQNARSKERLLRYDGIFNISIHSDYVSWSDIVGRGIWEIN
ncbi:ABC transporter ATP-binding protein [Nonlabens dokdonensis]|uniref:ABC transporter ATP-binding protein n=1 Tax=Nonlabens dokdonensis TaxID=328515 RepID=UPI0026F02A9E|nr:ABC transporter ATP-binding protein [Nonlabens dokdonensis]